MVGSTWDYYERLDLFIDTLHRINAQTPVLIRPNWCTGTVINATYVIWNLKVQISSRFYGAMHPNQSFGMIEEAPLYARVDMLRNTDGDLSLMELEVIEPFLYPLQGSELAGRIYSALRKRVSK